MNTLVRKLSESLQACCLIRNLTSEFDPRKSVIQSSSINECKMSFAKVQLSNFKLQLKKKSSESSINLLEARRRYRRLNNRSFPNQRNNQYEGKY